MTTATSTAWAPLIDTHVHVFERGLPLVTGATASPDYDFNAPDLIRHLDREGVIFCVLTAPSFLGTYADHMIETLRAHRRLRGTVIVEPDVEPTVLRAMADAGVVGVRFSLRRYPDLPDFTRPEWQRLLRRVRDLDWYIHMLAESERMAPLIPQLDKAGVKLVIDHYGVPDTQPLEKDPGFTAIRRAIQNGRTWVKLSAPYRVTGMDIQAITDILLAEAGASRLLWGSDCPWVSHEGTFSYRDTIDWFVNTVPDQAVREAIGRAGLALNKFV